MTASTIAIVLAGVLIALLWARLSTMQQRLDRLSGVEAKLDALMAKAGVTYDPAANAPASVVEALQQGNKIRAIKLYREARHVGLKEAKEFVDELERRSRRPFGI
jgi:ribosomal protein L7/L12